MKKMKVDRDYFFASVRKSLFGGQLTDTQVEGLNAILDACEAEDFAYKPYFAGPLGTTYHETGRTMKPVREGFAATDAGARAAVANLYARKKISRNYALPHANGLSYYGRGYPQLTHGDNYKKASLRTDEDLYAKPDKLLDPKISAKVLVTGMRYGDFTARSMANFAAEGHVYDYLGSRAIINGDKDKKMRGSKQTIGEAYAGYCRKFEAAIRFVEVEETPIPELDTPKAPAYTQPSLWDRFNLWLWQRVS